MQHFFRTVNSSCRLIGCSLCSSFKCLPLDHPIGIVLPFKDQRSADAVWKDLIKLGKKIGSDLRPVFTSRKIIHDIKVVEVKPPLINQHCVVYKLSCDLCDTDFVGYTSQHLFQHIAEHKHSSIGKHLKEEHRLQPTNLKDQLLYSSKEMPDKVWLSNLWDAVHQEHKTKT